MLCIRLRTVLHYPGSAEWFRTVPTAPDSFSTTVWQWLEHSCGKLISIKCVLLPCIELQCCWIVRIEDTSIQHGDMCDMCRCIRDYEYSSTHSIPSYFIPSHSFFFIFFSNSTLICIFCPELHPNSTIFWIPNPVPKSMFTHPAHNVDMCMICVD